MNASFGIPLLLKQRLSRIQHKRALNIDIVIKLMHELLWENTKKSMSFHENVQSSPSNVSLAKIQGIHFGVTVAPPPRSHRKIFACIVAPTYWAGSLCWSTWEEKKCS